MSFLLGVLIFIAALLVSIMLHEAGHFVTAKKFGMKVTQFFVGFGQTLWSRTKGETEYGVKAFLVGGYVKISGMTQLEDIQPEDEARTFRRHPGWQRIIVLAAGSFMHFVFALVLLFVLAFAVGLPVGASTTISVVDSCVPARAGGTACATGNPASPARLAGIKAGDKITSIAGTPVHGWAQMGKLIRSQPAGTPVRITVERNGRQLSLTASLVRVHGRTGSFLGVSPVTIYHRSGPVGAASYAANQFGQAIVGSAQLAASLPRVVPDLFSKNRANTPAGQITSVVGLGNVTGQVIASQIPWQSKVSLVLLIVASLNIFVGAFNLLPLLPLDGGHLAVVIFERTRAWLAKLRGRPDPGPVDFQRLVPLSVGVFALLVGLGVLLIMADLVNPVHIL
jgi:membrane-associated protease RseP (regulator of RpoE activity)